MSVEIDYERLREEMVEKQLAARGIRSRRVLDAMRTVRREGYVPAYLGEFAYQDAPLPIEEEQTISQPYIVGFMLQALELEPGARVLEIGTGSGYAAAVLGQIAAEVFSIERHAGLARSARERLRRDGYRNVHVRHGDGTLGWPEAAPFDAIVVAAGGPKVPEALRRQLKVGGRLVIPVGEEVGSQQLVRVRRSALERFDEERLAAVRFVPLVGREGWHEPAAPAPELEPSAPAPGSLARLVLDAAEPFDELETMDLRPLLERIGDARVVLLGESTHGTSEFQRLRARLTRELVLQRGFSIVAVEADWPDAACMDRYVRQRSVPRRAWRAFARFPAWMWRNREVQDFAEWLRAHNATLAPEQRVRFAGLDLYSLYDSIGAVLDYLERVDPAAARLARERYGCLMPWQNDPQAYGRAALSGAYRSCEEDVVQMLRELLQGRLAQARSDDEPFFDALQNARLVADAELYYRVMYYGSSDSWNLRDRHMYQTLLRLLDFHGPRARAVVWEHNSHVGDASATEMSARGELNLGQLCREHFRSRCYSIGFGTDHGSVAAASYWDGPLEVKPLRPALEDSYERILHETGLARFLLPLRMDESRPLRRALLQTRLERAVGVIYRPETERASHWFHAVLPFQFDEFAWLDETHAITPLSARTLAGLPDTYPFGL